ncbi:hypothetical protein AVEN_133017-1 [Araneus ventricosus]|uniref:Uncharacterized protein n=1 Tax=Araneus ventricosus TaxID=182803 RepID=A0A4Y2LLR3_ARAVE|nr:hypothetical protein AVEN_133017-1 [Araneus ventricosus]
MVVNVPTPGVAVLDAYAPASYADTTCVHAARHCSHTPLSSAIKFVDHAPLLREEMLFVLIWRNPSCNELCRTTLQK